MEYSKTGREIYPGRMVELYIEKNESLVENVPERFRLLILETGSFILNINGQQKLLEAPAFYCINHIDRISIGASSDTSYRVLYFSPAIINSKFDFSIINKKDYSSLSHTERQDLNWLNPFIASEEERQPFIKGGPASLRKILQLSDSMEKELEDEPDYFWPCRSRSFFLEILYGLHHFQSKFADIKDELQLADSEIDRILVFLHTHYHQPLTLNSLVERFNMNRTKINDLFHKATGQSVINYLINLRIKLACFILRDTMRPVQEIAFLTGFKDISHFGRTFKNITQHNPSEYREKFTWM